MTGFILNRRAFVGGIALAATLPGAFARAACGPTLSGVAQRRLRLLVLGGTRYLGPAVVRSALARGHDLTLFNRGRTAPGLFPGVEWRQGNRFPERESGLSALTKGEWDAVLDLSGQYPRVVEASARQLRGRVGRYLMVSSISAYKDYGTPDLDERAALRPLAATFEEGEDLVENDWATYGGRKAAGEAAVLDIHGDRAAILRPCSICGGTNNDGTGAYWTSRLHRDRTILLPGDGSDPTQLIDVGDVADFIILAAERELSGPYNLVGPADRLTFRDYIAAAARLVNSRSSLVWKGDFPRAMYGLPLSAPFHHVPGFATMRNERARAAGLKFRPLHDTLLSNWIDHRARRPADFDFAAAGIGLTREAEAALMPTSREFDG